MKAVTHAFPVAALDALNVKSTAQYHNSQHYYAKEAEVNTPQYVFFYVQFLRVSFISLS